MPSTNVLLTGGNGFIAVHIIVFALQRGYTVTTTVRSESKTTFLRQKFSEAVSKGQLKFSIVPDITTPGAFDDVFKNNSFDAVLHASSPFVFAMWVYSVLCQWITSYMFGCRNDVKNDLLLPAIQGTTEILKSAKAFGSTVKRVVVTSSFVSIFDPRKGNRPGYVYSEKDWNPVSGLPFNT